MSFLRNFPCSDTQDLSSSFHKTTNNSTLHKTAIVFPVKISPPVFQHGATSSSLFSQNSSCEYSLQCTSFSSAESGHNCGYRLYFSYHRPFGLSWRPWCTVFFSHTIKQELIQHTISLVQSIGFPWQLVRSQNWVRQSIRAFSVCCFATE